MKAQAARPHSILLLLPIEQRSELPARRPLAAAWLQDGSGSDALLQHPLAVLTAPDGKGAAAAWMGGTAVAASLLARPLLLLNLPTPVHRWSSLLLPLLCNVAVYVADSYNHRLKVLDPETAAIATVAGSGNAG